MVDGNKTIQGNKISKMFEGGIYEEISLLRRGVWANAVLRNPNDFTESEITLAEQYEQQLLLLHDQVESLLQ